MAPLIRNIILLALAVPGSLPLVAVAAPAKVLSTTVGQVASEVITSREVQINFLVEKALYSKGAKRGAGSSLNWGDKSFYRETNGVLLEWVVHLEAQNFAATKVTPAEIDQAEKSVRDQLRQNTQWNQLDVTRKELRLLLDRKIRAKKFIQFKAQSSVVPITDDEAQDYFEKNRTKFGDLPFANFKDNIKSFLSRQQVDRRLKDWFEVLQAKYKVRNLVTDT
ncbi:MAG: hypothetical protein IT288_07255 [Bdellovibrionales bacterium]|nr:hypothetical protein [Bdellovibrionales bacterium]